MESNPCNPILAKGAQWLSLRPAVSEFLFLAQSRFPAKRLQEAISCVHPYPSLPIASRKPLRRTIVSRIGIPFACGRRLTQSCQPIAAEEVHQGGEAALSCRLCLTACNLRQFDEAAIREEGFDA